MRTIREASHFDQLIACGWWNAREADASRDILRNPKFDLPLNERWYHERRVGRLTNQANDLFAQAAALRQH